MSESMDIKILEKKVSNRNMIILLIFGVMIISVCISGILRNINKRNNISISVMDIVSLIKMGDMDEDNLVKMFGKYKVDDIVNTKYGIKKNVYYKVGKDKLNISIIDGKVDTVMYFNHKE